MADYGTIYSLKDVFSRKKEEKQPKTGKKRGKTPIFELKNGGGYEKEKARVLYDFRGRLEAPALVPEKKR
ncbi:MAG: hypothetical protein J6W70_00960, partial [Lentisphaeria bacterium]|nr:hypothetical protein [Lentisphaeria bacterium]